MWKWFIVITKKRALLDTPLYIHTLHTRVYLVVHGLYPHAAQSTPKRTG